MPSLEHRIATLEENAGGVGQAIVLVNFYYEDPAPIHWANIAGKEVTQDGGESYDAFMARLRGMVRAPLGKEPVFLCITNYARPDVPPVA